MQKQLPNTTNTNRKNEFPKPKVECIMRAQKKVIYLDTCYLLDIVKCRRSLVEDIKYLSTKATVIIMKSVLDELKSNLASKSEFRQVKGRALAELNELFSLPYENENILIEEHKCTQKEIQGYSNILKLNSNGNARVGIGEASIISHLSSVIDLFDSAVILSNDSDVLHLVEGIRNVSVATNF
ncbi:MAG: hypothetical protein ACP5H8_03670 [Candidatus Micrarchaeia archaeon]